MGFILSLLISSLLTSSLPVQSSYTQPTPAIYTQAAQKPTINKLTVTSQGSDSKNQANLKIPIRLKIPKIKLDIALESVGLTSQGAVGVPKALANAAWFNLGPRPGDNGNAVITGHYGRWKNGSLGVFNNLYKLRKGDEIYVKDGKGSTTIFIVRKLQTFGSNEDAPSVFNTDDGKAHLNLITCAGVWNKVSQSYSQRLVIFTDKK